MPPLTVATSATQDLSTDDATPESKISNLANNTQGGDVAHNHYLNIFLEKTFHVHTRELGNACAASVLPSHEYVL